MKGTSKVIMGATLIMVVTLAVVLGLILVLLTELYCSLLLRRRRHLRASAAAAAAATTIRTNASPSSSTSNPHQHHPPPSLFSSIYAQGVLQAPRNFLFPLLSSKEELTVAKKQLVELHHQDFITSPSITSPRHLGLLSSSSSPPQPIQEVHGSVQGSDDTRKEPTCKEHLVYISNPIYENDEDGKGSSGSDTPLFQTPHTSPSRLETIGSSSGEDDEAAQASPSPHLSPMKKLPTEASSVSLKDAATTSLGNSGSDSHSNIIGLSSSSTSSATPCTSPSW